MKKPILVIMAAGMGSRFGGLKQIEPLGPNGEIIMDYSIKDAYLAGFGKVVFIIKEQFYEEFKKMMDKKMPKDMQAEYVFQELDMFVDERTLLESREKPWGTAHAVLCAKQAIDAPFAVINADDFYGRGAFFVLYEYLKNMDNKSEEKNHYAMVAYELKNTLTKNGHVARGVCEEKDGLLVSVVERLKIQEQDGVIRYTEDDVNWIPVNHDSLVSMNMWGFDTSLFDNLQDKFEKFLNTSAKNNIKAEYPLPTVINELMQENKCDVTVLRTDEKWFGVTYASDKQDVIDKLKEKHDNNIY